MSPEQQALEKYIENETRKFALSERFLEQFKITVYDKEITRAEVKELRCYQPLNFPDIEDLYRSDLRQAFHPVGNGNSLICCVLDLEKKIMAGMGMLINGAERQELYYLQMEDHYRRHFADWETGLSHLRESYEKNRQTYQTRFAISSQIKIGIADVIVEKLKEFMEKPCVANTNGFSFRLLLRHGFEEKGGVMVMYTPEGLRKD